MIGLQALREAAGYRSGRRLAAELGVAPATYTRWERDPDQMPLHAAWDLADFFGVSIDAVVGRAEADAGALAGPVQQAYDALDEESRARVDDYIDILERASSAPGAIAAARADGVAEGAALSAPRGGADRRAEVRAALEAGLRERGEAEVEEEYRSARASLDREGALDAAGPHAAEVKEELLAELDAIRQTRLDGLAEEIGEEVDRVMAAYDARAAREGA